LRKVGYPKGSSFNFKGFAKFLTNNDRKCVLENYYIGILKIIKQDPKSIRLYKGQQRFLDKLIKNDGFKLVPGRIMYDKGRIREKGTDVKIAVDLIVGAMKNKYDIAIIVSSDTDLIPAIEEVKNLKKKIEYIGFSKAPSFGMIKKADESKLLSQKELKDFISKP
jgi:uncharacterized LabA/DUF88 family protein